MALAWYLDGRVSAVIGTHTHVQTADERILPKKTAFISDAGMTGPVDSVIGLDTDTAIKRFIHQIPEKYQIATENIRLNAVLLQIDADTGHAMSIERLNLP
jgi:calcineurin-like phosphoesterase